MNYKIRCTRNENNNPNYKTVFQWEDYSIEIDYNYDMTRTSRSMEKQIEEID